MIVQSVACIISVIFFTWLQQVIWANNKQDSWSVHNLWSN